MIRNLVFSLFIIFIHHHVISADQVPTLTQDGMLPPFEDEADLDEFFSRDLWYSMDFSHPIVKHDCYRSKKSHKSHKSRRCRSRKSKSSSSKSSDGHSSGKGGKGGKGSSGKGGKGSSGKGGKGGKGSSDESDEDYNSKGWSSSDSSKGTGISSYSRSFPTKTAVSNDKTKTTKVEVKKVKHVA